MARPWKLPESDLAVIARESVDRSNVAREALTALVNDRSASMKHRHAVALLERALAVDLTKPADRKGPVPAALGLVTRTDHARAVWLAMDRTLSTSMRDDRAKCCVGTCAQTPARLACFAKGSDPTTQAEACRQTFVFPKNAKEAAQAVVDGFYAADLDRGLTVDAVLKIWQRGWKADSKTTR